MIASPALPGRAGSVADADGEVCRFEILDPPRRDFMVREHGCHIVRGQPLDPIVVPR